LSAGASTQTLAVFRGLTSKKRGGDRMGWERGGEEGISSLALGRKKSAAPMRVFV